MKARSRVVSGLLLMPFALIAQIRQPDAVALKRWAAPPYGQPSRPERDASEARLSAVGAPAPHAPSPANPFAYVGMTPCRGVDTRSGQGFPGAFGPLRLAGQTSRMFPVQSGATCTIPIAQAYSFNITVAPSTPAGFLTACPTGQPLPLAATSVWSQGSITSSAAVAPGGTSGFKAVNYSELPLEAIRELDAQNQSIQEQYKSELEQNRSLESRIAALEAPLTRKDC